ncbi:MAG: tripartite tricarboxylate transporter TctB family protein [Candidatus Rokuibacteriota bacterium]
MTPPRALALLLVAAGLYADADAGWRMPLGTPGTPGPGMLPLALGVAVALLAGATLLQRAPPEAAEPMAGRRPTEVAALLVLYPLLLPRAGFALTTALVIFLIGRAIAPAAPARLAVFALASAAGAVVLFRRLLAVPLPGGPWGF